MDIEAMEFFDLKQLVKTMDKPYLQCFRIEEDKAIYYEICGDVFVFCTDKYYPFEYIKLLDKEFVGTNLNDSANCIGLAHVKNDSLLLQVLALPEIYAKEAAKAKRKRALAKKSKSKKKVLKRKSV
jgi:hypothetical protein